MLSVIAPFITKYRASGVNWLKIDLEDPKAVDSSNFFVEKS